MEFQVNVYNYSVENTVPPIEFGEDGSVLTNHEYTFADAINQDGSPYKCYYRDTKKLNGVIITIPGIKKHKKQVYIDAVKGQLLYFPPVRLFERRANGHEDEIIVKADVMYENDNIVLSKNSMFSKPHLLLNNISYGYINYQELELEEKLGNIGIKVDPNNVTISPSRETLVWDDITREEITRVFNTVVEVAQKAVSDELKEEDFMVWLRAASQAGATRFDNRAEDTIIGRLSRIVDMSKVEVTYVKNKHIKFGASLLDGIDIRFVGLNSTREGSKTIKKVMYESSYWRTPLMEGKPIIMQSTASNNRKNKYILQQLYPAGFLNIGILPEWLTLGRPLTPEDISMKMAADAVDKREMKADEKIIRMRNRIATLYNFILESKGLSWYEDIEVPESFTATENEEEITEDEVQTKEVVESAAERRKLLGDTILFTPRINHDGFVMHKVELKPHLVDTWANEEIFWSNKDTEPMMYTAALITRYIDTTPNEETLEIDDTDLGSVPGLVSTDKITVLKNAGYKNLDQYSYTRLTNFDTKAPVRLIRVAQQNVKHYKDFKHITKFFREIKGKIITMSNALVRWNTARLIQSKLSKLRFLAGFESISPTKHQQYVRLYQYVNAYWRSLNFSNTVLGADYTATGQLNNYLDNVGKFQLFVRENPDDATNIALLAQQLFNPEAGVEIQDARAIDLEIYDLYQELTDWAEPIQVMLNMVKPLVTNDGLTDEQEAEIRTYLGYRNCQI